MSRQKSALFSLLVVTAASSLVVVACSDAERPPASGSTTDAAAFELDASVSPHDSGLPSTPDAADGAILCPVPALGGPMVTGRFVSGMPPDDTGGAITPGTYDLTDLAVYEATSAEEDGGVDGGAPDHAQATFVVTSDTISLSKSASSPLSGGAAVTTMYVAKQHVSDVFLVLDDTCPGTDSRKIPFSSTSTTITLHSSQVRRETYTKR